MRHMRIGAGTFLVAAVVWMTCWGTASQSSGAVINKGLGRKGGESRGGGSKARRQQRINLFKEFGGEKQGYIVCMWTGIRMHWSDDKAINPNGYPKFERGKIFTKHQGGGYQLLNLIPESFQANRFRNDKIIRKENTK